PRSRLSASPSILSWYVWRLCIQARSSFGCTAKTRTRRARASLGIANATVSSPAPASAAALRQRVDPRRKLEVALGDPALRVRGERDRDLVPGDRQVRVVVHLLGGLGDPVHEVDRPPEVVELELPPERVAVALPTLGLAEP